MSDDKDKRDFRDRERININEPYEREYWSKKFGVTEEELKRAVSKAGVMVKEVERELKGSS